MAKVSISSLGVGPQDENCWVKLGETVLDYAHGK